LLRPVRQYLPKMCKFTQNTYFFAHSNDCDFEPFYRLIFRILTENPQKIHKILICDFEVFIWIGGENVLLNIQDKAASRPGKQSPSP
jgi:hypothetical protein